MKRLSKFMTLALAVCLSLIICGCSSSMAYTFGIGNGESIRVTLDTSSGCKLCQSDGTFYIEDGGEILTQGLFMMEADYRQYFENAPGSDGVTVLDENEKDGNAYLFYAYSDGESTVYYHIVAVRDTSVGIGLVNTISQKSAEECFGLLTFQAA